MLLTQIQPNPIQLLWVNPNSPNYPIIKITKMPFKWKPRHFLRFPFPLSLVSILGIKKIPHKHIHISNYIKNPNKIFFSFLFYFLSLSWQPNNAKNTKKISFQAQNFSGISKAIVLKTNRNYFEPKKEKNERILINYSILKWPKFKINKK